MPLISKPRFFVATIIDMLSIFSNTMQTPQKKPLATTTTATSTAGLPTIPTLSSAATAHNLISTSQIPDYLLPSLLNYAQQNANKVNNLNTTNTTSSANNIKSALGGGGGGGGLQFDPSSLTLPTTLHPNVLTSPVHHDMLRSISMANARDTTQNAQSLAPPLPPPNPSSLSSVLLAGPTFSQSPAGAHITKGVDQITMDQERLQQSLDALGQHGLNIDNFDLDDDFDGGGNSYLALANSFGELYSRVFDSPWFVFFVHITVPYLTSRPLFFDLLRYKRVPRLGIVPGWGWRLRWVQPDRRHNSPIQPAT